MTEILPTTYNILELAAINNANVSANWNPDKVVCPSTRNMAVSIADGLSFIRSKRNTDGGFGLNRASTIAETAMAYKAISSLASPVDPDAVAALGYLVAQQDTSTTPAKGSWGNDAYLTTLVMSVYPSPPTPLTDTDHDGIPDAVEILIGRNPNVWDNKVSILGGRSATARAFGGSSTAIRSQGDSPSPITISIVGGGAAAARLTISGALADSTPRFAHYTRTLTASGGTPPYSWSIISGSLPPGLSIDSLTGAVSGNPSALGAYGFDLAVTDTNRAQISVRGTITVTSSPLERAIFQHLLGK